MKKAILFLALLFSLNSCKGQEENKQKVINNKSIKNNNMEHFDIEKYKDWEVDTTYIAFGEDQYYKKNDRRVSVSFGGEYDIIVNETDNTPYKTYKRFSKKTKSLLDIGKSFYDVDIEAWKYYDETGSLINEINEDTLYKLSVEDIIKIAKQEYNIDLMDISMRYKVSRNDSGLPQYFIHIPKPNSEGIYRIISIDALTGKTVSDDILDSTKKWQKNKETSKKMGYHEYREKGIRVHQIYEDVCYTEDEWNEFIKTKSWWWRKLNT